MAEEEGLYCKGLGECALVVVGSGGGWAGGPAISNPNHLFIVFIVATRRTSSSSSSSCPCLGICSLVMRAWNRVRFTIWSNGIASLVSNVTILRLICVLVGLKCTAPVPPLDRRPNKIADASSWHVSLALVMDKFIITFRPFSKHIWAMGVPDFFNPWRLTLHRIPRLKILCISKNTCRSLTLLPITSFISQ